MTSTRAFRVVRFREHKRVAENVLQRRSESSPKRI
jgi:hypothetical protein